MASQITKLREPILGVSHTPMEPLKPSDMHVVPLDVPIETLAPRAQGLLICRVNGEFLARESWASTTRYGDVIEFYDVPENKDVLRLALTLAVMYFTMGTGGAAIFGTNTFLASVAAMAGMIAINALLPPTQQEDTRQKPKDVFSASLSGNQARLDEPIWKTCGRREITPPFACQPYVEYRSKIGESDPNIDNEQFYYALFAIGVGEYDISAKIGNTPISRFEDVNRREYLPPGTLPTDSNPLKVVLANVTTATEVSSQVLEGGVYCGGFSACAPNRTCEAIGIDVVATRGLGKGEDALTVKWRVEYRTINDFGQATGPWTHLKYRAPDGTLDASAEQTRTARTSTPQRWSVKYEIDTPARVEVRLLRTDVEDTDPSALHEIAWTGLRAYLAETAPLNTETSHFAVVIRATAQLSTSTSHDFRLIVKGKCRTLNSDLEWQALVHTRNPVWWLLDLITSDTWGIDKPDARVDLQSFYDLAMVAEARQDRFDYTFDSSMNAWDAMQLIARAARARVFRRNGVISVARDELAELPVTAFTPRNCQPGMTISETLRQRNSPDGIVIEYQDHRNWEWTPIEVTCPGHPDVAVNPVIKRLEGVTGATHAHREALYEAANMMYRTRTVSFKTEMQGILPAYMSPVDFLPDVVGYGHSGDVAFWDVGTLSMGLTEPADFSTGALYLTLIRDDGSLTDPVLVSPGASEYDIVLPAAPDFTLVVDDGTRERPKYLLGVKDTVKITAIMDGGQAEGGAQIYDMAGVIDDERVHLADIALLPGPGEIQDPTGEPDEEVGNEASVLVNLSNHIVLDRSFDASVHSVARYTLYNDGTSGSWSQSGLYPDETYAHEWMYNLPADPVNIALFEARATFMGGTAITSGTLDTWTSLSTSQYWELDVDDGHYGYTATLLIEIREAATLEVVSYATITLRVFMPGPGGR